MSRDVAAREAVNAQAGPCACPPKRASAALCRLRERLQQRLQFRKPAPLRIVDSSLQPLFNVMSA
jgi:hypothetical protein